jgi:hypothetical protein
LPNEIKIHILENQSSRYYKANQQPPDYLILLRQFQTEAQRGLKNILTD